MHIHFYLEEFGSGNPDPQPDGTMLSYLLKNWSDTGEMLKQTQLSRQEAAETVAAFGCPARLFEEARQERWPVVTILLDLRHTLQVLRWMPPYYGRQARREIPHV